MKTLLVSHYQRLRDVLGEGHADERGMMTAVNLMVFCLCILLFALLWNISWVTKEKVQMQNAADAIAISAGTQCARGMNAITATNHVMGEMMALVIIHEAVGAELMYPPKQIETTAAEDGDLDDAWAEAVQAGAKTPAYETVRQHEGIDAQRTLIRAKRNLKVELTNVYRSKISARKMQMSRNPAVVAEGVKLEKAMDEREQQIGKEYRALKQLHAIASVISPLKHVLADDMLPSARQYTELVAAETPALAHETSLEIAHLHHVQATTQPYYGVGGSLRLPVRKDPFALRGGGDDSRDQMTRVTQLARATFPWVNYHRAPIAEVLRAVTPLSKASSLYLQETDRAGLRLLDKMQTDHHRLGLYVLDADSARDASPDRGYEPWTGHPHATNSSAREADRLFGLVGLAHAGSPKVLGNQPGIGRSTRPVFRRHHQDGRTALAQVLLYNGNAQRPSNQRIDFKSGQMPLRQADVGWDTLNWREGTPPFEFHTYDAGITVEYPQIQVNWQVKLVPVTEHQMRTLKQHAQHHGAAMHRLLPRQSLRTH